MRSESFRASRQRSHSVPEGKSPTLGDQLTQGAPLAVLMVLSLSILYQLRSILQLIAIAILVSLVLQTLLSQLEKLLKQRWLAIISLVIGIVGLTVLLPIVILPDLVVEFQKLTSKLPEYLSSLTQQSQNLHAHYSFIPDISTEITKLNDFLYGLVKSLPLLLEKALGITVEAFAILILALYITYDPGFLAEGLLRLTPRRHHSSVKRILKTMRVRLQGWMSGTFLAMLFLGIGVGIGLWILGIPLVLPFAIIAGLFEIIPFFGSFVGGFLPALVALTISPLKLVLVVVLFLILNQIDSHIFQPIVVGHQVNLNPVGVVITVLIMSELLGIVGLIFAIPAAVVIMSLFDEFTAKASLAETARFEPPS
ncbi:AI-2E family transporter [Waterburya agarophytonicola K14]|uniref:AI-2E family transporter n=2 Tax=Waterburya TaxID=2886915 RepID=A0A964BTE3_9CYAN|nr:AI-2E family transporter [Waterburya agarophytonicola KI4]